ncbi:MAG: PQQ-dependent sugar dehydrogenase [Pseudomonadota bacterium]
MNTLFFRLSQASLLAMLVSQAAVGHHNPPPLDDPIPGGIPMGPYTLVLEEVVADLAFPIDVVAPPDGSGRLFVTERAGRIRIIEDGVLLPEPFLDITDSIPTIGSAALSAIEFHPNFATSGHLGQGRLYTVSQEAPGSGIADFGDTTDVFHQSVVYEWRADFLNPNVVLPSSQREIIRINENSSVHNVNDLAFGSGGLYIAKGDDDMNADGVLDGTTIHGSILRLDVNLGGDGYLVPPGNPFVSDGSGRLPEIYAYGFRNPWRIVFDTINGVILAADIGEDDIEEVNRVEAGGYYGWIDLEGSFAFLDFNGVTDDLSDLPPGLEHVLPIAQYDHTEGDRSITGGVVYRGSLVPSLQGQYVFGDWISGRLFHMSPGGGQIAQVDVDFDGASLLPGIITVTEDQDGELLLVVTDASAGTGRVLRLAAGLGVGIDTDGDGVDDDIDNCTLDPNPQQIDSNGDLIGNVCDADIAGPAGAGLDDCVVAFFDLGQLKNVFFTNDPDADLVGPNGSEPDGVVNFFDLGRMKERYFLPPGPSAAGCN